MSKQLQALQFTYTRSQEQVNLKEDMLKYL